MIVSFSISNFRSFSSEETFSAVASSRLSSSKGCHLSPIPGTDKQALRTSVMYGANGAGKSNFFKALSYLKRMAISTRKKDSGTGREPFRMGDIQAEPTELDLQFIAGGNLYRFGLRVDDVRVMEEWLVKVDGNKEKILYERITDSEGFVTVEAKGLKVLGDKLSALAVLGGPQNQTFLATILSMLDDSAYGKDLNSVLEWFGHKLQLIKPDSPYLQLGARLDDDPKFQSFAGEFLQSVSTGVDSLIVDKTELSEDDLKNILPEEVVSRVLEHITEQTDGGIHMGDGTEIVYRAEEKEFFLVKTKAVHKLPDGKKVNLELKEESDGTKRLLNLIPALHNLKSKDFVYVIDEIDRSMHPILTWNFINFFLSSCNVDHQQIIVTTHESNLLDMELLRRDEIWFAEKDQNAATRLYSLSEFKVRKDLEIRKHYLQGRFGAIPYLGSLDRLICDEEAPE